MKNKGLWIGLLIAGLGLICLAMVAVVVIFAARAGYNIVSSNQVMLNSPSYSARTTEDKSFTVDGATRLIVNQTFGKVDVRGVEGTEIKISATKYAWGMTQAEADENLNKVVVESIQSGDTLTITIRYASNQEWINSNPGSVDLLIEAPITTSLEIESQDGEIYAAGFQGSADLSSDFGDVTAANINGGPVKLSSQNGKLTLDSVDAGSNDITLKTDFGEVEVDQVKSAGFKVQAQNGTIDMNSVKATGKVELISDFGEVIWQEGEADSLTADMQNGKFTLRNVVVKGDIVATDDFGSIEFTNIRAGGSDLTTQNGSIEAEILSGKVTARSDFGDIDIKGVNATLDLTSQNGAIRYEGSLSGGPHTVKTEFGNVTLILPKDTGLTVDLSTEFGQIKSELGITIKDTIEEKHWVGEINGGGMELNVSANNGNITIETAQ